MEDTTFSRLAAVRNLKIKSREIHEVERTNRRSFETRYSITTRLIALNVVIDYSSGLNQLISKLLVGVGPGEGEFDKRLFSSPPLRTLPCPCVNEEGEVA